MTSSTSEVASLPSGVPPKMQLDDPHGVAELQESEVSRVRALHGVWRWLLMAATLATILLCINQQFALRFFIDYTQLNTEYFYLLIALMLSTSLASQVPLPGRELTGLVAKIANDSAVGIAAFALAAAMYLASGLLIAWAGSKVERKVRILR